MLRQRNGVFQPQLGAGANGEVGGVGGVADEHDAVVLDPVAAENGGEVDPGRAADMGGVGEQFVAIEIVGKDPPTGFRALLVAHVLEAEGVVDIGIAFDNEGRSVLVKLVGVGPDPAVLGFFEDKGKGIPERLLGAQPDKLVAAHINVAVEGLEVAVADFRVETVGSHDHIGIGEAGVDVLGRKLGFEVQLHAQFAAALVQHLQHALAPQADKAVAVGTLDLTLEVTVDHVPMDEFVDHALAADRVGLHQGVDGLVGENHPPAKSVVGPVALIHRDLVGRVVQLHANCQIQPGWATTETDYLHTTLQQAHWGTATARQIDNNSLSLKRIPSIAQTFYA